MKNAKFSVLSVICGLLAIAAALVYAFSVSRDHSPIIIAAMALAGVCSLILSRKKLPFTEYIPFVLTLVSLSIFIRLAFDEISDILSKNNMNGLSITWIASAVLILLAGIVSGICTVAADEG